LSGHPNNVAISKDGRRVYIAIRDPEPGGVDVVDIATKKMVKTIPTKGAIHNPYVTPDGKYVVAWIDLGADRERHRPEDRRARVDAEDGSRRAAHDLRDQSGRLHEVDLRPDERLQRFCRRRFRDAQGDQADPESRASCGKKTVPEGADPSHGMAVTADGKTLIVVSRLNNYLYSYSLPDLKNIGGAELSGMGGGWVTLTPDGKARVRLQPGDQRRIRR
jgi:hypothetical protein